MKSKYFKVLLISVILLFILAGCGRKASQQGTTQAPSIDSELNSMDKGLKDVDSIPSDVQVPAESSSPVDEFNKLSNSMDEGISDVEATPSDVAEG